MDQKDRSKLNMLSMSLVNRPSRGKDFLEEMQKNATHEFKQSLLAIETVWLIQRPRFLDDIPPTVKTLFNTKAEPAQEAAHALSWAYEYSCSGSSLPPRSRNGTLAKTLEMLSGLMPRKLSLVVKKASATNYISLLSCLRS